MKCNKNGIPFLPGHRGSKVPYERSVLRPYSRQCLDKLKYPNRDSALMAHHATRSQHGRPYPCPWCGQWHLGHWWRRS